MNVRADDVELTEDDLKCIEEFKKDKAARKTKTKEKKTGEGKTETETHFCSTRIFQGDDCFVNIWSFNGKITKGNVIKHLTAIFEEEIPEDEIDVWDMVSGDTWRGQKMNCYGMSPKEFATFLVKHRDEAEKLYDTTFQISHIGWD